MDKSEQLIEEVRRNESLFDLSAADYKNNNKKAQIWKKIAETMNLAEDECRKRWKGLRDTYKRRRRAEMLASGSGAPNPTKRWKYMDALAFLENFKGSRDTVGSIEESETIFDCSSSTSIEENMCSLPTNARELEASFSQVRKPSKRRADVEVTQVFRELMEDCVGTVKALGSAISPEEGEPTALLFSNLAKRIAASKLTPEEVRRIEGKVVALVHSELNELENKRC